MSHAGSTTFKREARERGLEPGECYCLGRDLAEAPDIALEIVVTSGGVDRLAVYGGLGDHYRSIDRSELVPGLDFGGMAELVATPDQHAAVKAFRDRLRVALPTG